MSIPQSVIRFKKGNVEYVSSCDRAAYTIQELTRAALRDVGKLLCRKVNEKAQSLPGMKRSSRVRGRSSAFQYWVRKNECDLQFGCKHGTWYGEKQELGTSKMPKKGFMYDAAQENIADIITIESKYLSALEDEASALSMINEDEYRGNENE